LRALARIPVTLLFAIATIVLFVAARTTPGILDNPPRAWRALTPSAVNRPHFWLFLLLSAVYHSGVGHLASNTLAFVPLSARAESRYGSWLTLAFIVLAAAVASSVQMVVSGHGDIGSSGVVFGLVGWAISTDGLAWRSARAMTLFVGALLLWYVYCFVANKLLHATYGNASHTAGLLLGIGWGIVWRGTPRRLE
jgi:membrane associated rhomboid family serine protease